MLHSPQKPFQTARRGIESAGRWLAALFHLALAAVALAAVVHVLPHSPIVHGLAGFARGWLKTVNLFELLKGIF